MTARKTPQKPVVRPVSPVLLGPDGEPLTPPQIAALSLPLMTDAECREVARIFAGIERRRATTTAAPAEEVA